MADKPDAGRSLGVTGSSGGGSTKKRLIDDVRSAVDLLNKSLETSVRLSKQFADNFKGLNLGGIAGGGAAPSFNLPPISGAGSNGPATVNGSTTTPTGFQGANPKSTIDSMGFMTRPEASTWDKFKGALPGIAAGAVAASVQAINPQDFIENEMARRRFGFFSGVGGYAGAALGGNTASSLMRRGTFMNAQDANSALMSGASMGMMPGLPNYNAVVNSYAAISNLTPGVSGEQAAGAVASLNSAQSVNRLRMLGIQVRDGSGLFKGVTDIGNQLWSVLEKQKLGGGRITAQDLSLSLQPGNALSSLMDQYFGNDPVLRDSVIAYLYQRAAGGSMSKASLQSTNATPGVAQSFGARASSAYGAINAYTSSGVQGVEMANSVIAAAADTFKNSVDVFGGYVMALSGLQTLGGGANGAFGTFGGSLLGSLAGRGIFKGAGKGLGNAARNVINSGPLESTAALEGAPVAQSAIADVSTSALTSVAPLAALTATTGAMYAGAYMSDRAGYAKLIQQQVAAAKQAGHGYYSATDWLTGIYANNSAGNIQTGNMAMGGDESGGNIPSGSTATPLASGLMGNITSKWGETRNIGTKAKPIWNGPHGGMDIAVPKGTSVRAVRNGKVIQVGNNPKGFGNYAVIQHDDGMQTLYGHLSQALVTEGLTVTAGSEIGKSGSTGLSTGPHLHFQVQKHLNSSYAEGTVDPAAYLSGASGNSPVTATSGHSAGAYSSAGNALSGSAMFSGMGGDSGGGGSSTYYGGVTVNIHVPSGTTMDETKLAREVKRILSEENRFRMAVTR